MEVYEEAKMPIEDNVSVTAEECRETWSSSLQQQQMLTKTAQSVDDLKDEHIKDETKREIEDLLCKQER